MDCDVNSTLPLDELKLVLWVYVHKEKGTVIKGVASSCSLFILQIKET